MAASTPSTDRTRATSSSEKPSVETTRRSQSLVPSYQRSAAARMSGPVICRPAKKPQPRATMPMIARKRPRDPRIERATSRRNMCGRAAMATAYHSSDIASTGDALRSTLLARPSKMRITRSAIWVKAELCVTMATVRPSLRQLSWRSLRIWWPVT